MQLLMASVLLLLAAAPAFAQGALEEEMARVRQELEALKEGQQAIQRELQALRTQLAQAPQPQPAAPPAEVTLDLSGEPSRGAADAALVMVEFTDYQ